MASCLAVGRANPPISGREEGETHVRASKHDTGCSGQGGRRHAPDTGADPAPAPEDGGVQRVRSPGRSAERQDARRVLLGERGGFAGPRAGGRSRAEGGGGCEGVGAVGEGGGGKVRGVSCGEGGGALGASEQAASSVRGG